MLLLAAHLTSEEYMKMFHLLGDISDDLKQQMLWFYRVTFTDSRRILNVAYTSRRNGCDCHYAFRTAQLNQEVLQQLVQEMERLVPSIAVEEVQVGIVMQ